MCNGAVSEGEAFVLAYSVTSRQTFEQLEVLRQAIIRLKGENAIFVVVGNKSDLQEGREVPLEEGRSYADSCGCKFLETSAKARDNVDELFGDLVGSLRARNGVPVPTVDRTHRGCVPGCFIM